MPRFEQDRVGFIPSTERKESISKAVKQINKRAEKASAAQKNGLPSGMGEKTGKATDASNGEGAHPELEGQT